MEKHKAPTVANAEDDMRLVERIRIERIRTRGYHADEVPYNNARS